MLNLLYRGKSIKHTADHHKNSMPSMTHLNNYNSSQKITEKNGNNIRNSAGWINNIVGKVDKGDKNLKNTQNLKGSYSITNFQAVF